MSTTDNLTKYGKSFQSKVLSALLTDQKFLDSLSDIISPNYFESDADKWVAEEIIKYHNQYRKSPTLDYFKVQTDKISTEILKVAVVEQLRHIYTGVGNVDLDYIKDEFRSFCINQNLKSVILKSVDELKAGNYDKIKDMVDNAMKVGVEIDLGHDYIEDFDERSKDEDRAVIPTNWDVIDDLMDGGLGPGELGVVVAPSGVGKCVGGDTKIDIQYEEIGFELTNGHVVWFKPWDKIKLNELSTITAYDASKIIELTTFGGGKNI